jgi:hypothetical protein
MSPNHSVHVLIVGWILVRFFSEARTSPGICTTPFRDAIVVDCALLQPPANSVSWSYLMS